MTTQSIDTGAWESVVTTSGDTVFQNRGATIIYLTTESTGSLPLDDGVELAPRESVVVSDGQSVSATSVNAACTLFYMAL